MEKLNRHLNEQIEIAKKCQAEALRAYREALQDEDLAKQLRDEFYALTRRHDALTELATPGARRE